MKNFGLVVGLVALLAAGAWAADMIVEKAPPAASIEEPSGYDATVELKWDTGATAWVVAYYTGAGAWVANDFDISTVKTYPYVQSIRMFCYSLWPNTGWDGGRLGVYSYAGGVPGSLIWGPKFIMPTGGNGFKDFEVGWSLPGGLKKFLPAYEQYYNYPNCDPHVIDNNPTFLHHSWSYFGGSWQPYSNSTPGYYNIMLRVIMDNEHNPGVAPTSVGRVKALYF
jgi:hypothetical protein